MISAPIRSFADYKKIAMRTYFDLLGRQSEPAIGMIFALTIEAGLSSGWVTGF
jgi:hypothetical protein